MLDDILTDCHSAVPNVWIIAKSLNLSNDEPAQYLDVWPHNSSKYSNQPKAYEPD